MTITFASILFSLFFLFRNLQKNVFFILYCSAMIVCAYVCENNFNLASRPFSEKSFMFFVLLHILFINFFTFCAYGRDKHLAKIGGWRIPEVQLHTLELMGGTIGGYIAQKFFCHKYKKKSYMGTFFATVLIQIIAILFIFYRLKM